ncbi:MAG: hypothetical protein ACI9EW_001712 [Cellvibrionaceae bacterium]|jgi:hypothetical protein
MLFKDKTVDALPIPQIDQSVPATLETATFALG